MSFATKREGPGGKRAGAGRPGKGGKSITLRLSKGGLLARSELAALWGCDQTRAVEECLAAMMERAVTSKLPPLKHRPALDGPAE